MKQKERKCVNLCWQPGSPQKTVSNPFFHSFVCPPSYHFTALFWYFSSAVLQACCFGCMHANTFVSARACVHGTCFFVSGVSCMRVLDSVLVFLWNRVLKSGKTRRLRFSIRSHIFPKISLLLQFPAQEGITHTHTRAHAFEHMLKLLVTEIASLCVGVITPPLVKIKGIPAGR